MAVAGKQSSFPDLSGQFYQVDQVLNFKCSVCYFGLYPCMLNRSAKNGVQFGKSPKYVLFNEIDGKTLNFHKFIF